MNLHAAQEKAAASLVQRARAGDQNAMGMIARTAENAKKGNPRAISAYNAIEGYIRKYPFQHRPQRASVSSMGFEARSILEKLKSLHRITPMGVLLLTQLPRLGYGGREALAGAATLLANGPWLTNQSIFGALEEAPQDIASRVSFGFECARNPVAQHAAFGDPTGAIFVGQCLDMACRIQAVRQPHTPISVLSRRAGWELGE